MNCIKCSRPVGETGHENGMCFFCDPTLNEVREMNAVMRIMEILNELEDATAMHRVVNWATHKIGNDLEERRLQSLKAEPLEMLKW